MSLIKTAHKNILETSTVTLSVGSEDVSFPLPRLYDRDIGLVFKGSSSADLTVKIDQGATNIILINSIVIPAGHDLDGGTYALSYSDNDTGYTDAIAATVISGSANINVDFTPGAHRYWKLALTSLSQIPAFAELFLTTFYEWPRNPARPAGALDSVPNVLNVTTPGGSDRFIKRGPPKKRKDYRLEMISEAHRAELEDLYATFSDGKPFYIIDHEADLFYAKLFLGLGMTEIAPGRYNADFPVIEVLG